MDEPTVSIEVPLRVGHALKLRKSAPRIWTAGHDLQLLDALSDLIPDDFSAELAEVERLRQASEQAYRAWQTAEADLRPKVE